MSPIIIISVLALYFLMLIGVSYITHGKGDNSAFFTGNRNANWYVVAFGMIGASLSGVTFISVPGWIATSGFSYMQMVLGYVLGYCVVAFVLLPLYYKRNLTSIYVYLGERFGPNTHLTGTLFFLVSRLLGSALRLFLVADVLHHFVFEAWGMPFWSTVAITLVLIWIYTHRGGIKTIIWTDTLQTIFMLVALILGIVLLAAHADVDNAAILEQMRFSNWWITEDPNAGNYWWKHFFGGMFVTIAMTGLDQDMMQKNLTCRNIGDAKKNMLSLSVILVFVNFIFLLLGAYLFAYLGTNEDLTSAYNAMDEGVRNDRMFPMVALSGELGYTFGILFIVGLIAAAYSSADSAITALTTSVCYDLLKIDKKSKIDPEKTRKTVHILVTFAVFITILIANLVKEQNVISTVFFVAGFTYGPLLGLFFFGILTKRQIRDRWSWLVCLAIPVFLYFVSTHDQTVDPVLAPQDLWFNGYKFGYEMLGINGILCFLGLLLISSPAQEKNPTE
jgi:SSS family transporter